MSRFLEKLDFPNDIKTMSYEDLELLSYEIRDFLIGSVSRTGGHLSSNLGIVEISLAVHRMFDPPQDKLIWDVGHQTYVHKILTGRMDRFPTLRKFKGMSGFPKPQKVNMISSIQVTAVHPFPLALVWRRRAI